MLSIILEDLIFCPDEGCIYENKRGVSVVERHSSACGVMDK